MYNNTNVGNVIPKHMTFKPNKMKQYPPQIIFLQRAFEPLVQTTRKQCVDVMQGGLNICTILPSGHSTQAYTSSYIENPKKRY